MIVPLGIVGLVDLLADSPADYLSVVDINFLGLLTTMTTTLIQAVADAAVELDS